MVEGISKAPRTFPQLAEPHVAGLFAEQGWLVYFPHRDEGFDFVAMREIEGQWLIRPVQVKGRYPTEGKADKPIGYIGALTKIHPDMVLAIPFFETGVVPIIRHVAFMPRTMIRLHAKGYRCLPARFQQGQVRPRGDHQKFFDHEGLKIVSSTNWSKETLSEAELMKVDNEDLAE